MDDATVVKRGWWLYAGTIRCDVHIVERDFFPGTGDYEDPPEIGDDRDIICYELRYEIPGYPPKYAGGGSYLTIEEAAA